MREIYINTIAMGHAVAFGSGNLSKDNFLAFLDGLEGNKKDIQKDLEEMKAAGLPIEEI